jgi:hypothetical protein
LQIGNIFGAIIQWLIIAKNSEAALSPSKGSKMTFPEWMKPGIYGAIIGAIVVSILGFSWGGWTTIGAATKMADNHASEKVTQAMVPVCMEMFKADPQGMVKMEVVRDTTKYKRDKAFMATGWATLPGTEDPSRDLASACIDAIELDAS